MINDAIIINNSVQPQRIPEVVQTQTIPISQVKEQSRILKIGNKVFQSGSDALRRGKNWFLSGFSAIKIGGNNTDYIYYKLKNKIYKRKIRYDKNNNEYVIINKIVYYI
jgi:hypothetical protein